MTERIKKAIDIFLDAINNGTLNKGNCYQCAVGNLVAEGLGLSNSDNYLDKRTISKWHLAFCTGVDTQIINKLNFDDEEVLKCVKATDFSIEELMKIENTFERNSKIDYFSTCSYTAKELRNDKIKALEAVVKVMLSFDEDKSDVKEIFTSKAELIPL